jgi:two-component system chemotaxis family response regulator WspR
MTTNPGAPPMDPAFLPDKYLSLVLLVDDQVMICEAVRRALAGEQDVDFHYCTNPSDALRVAEEVKPTVILQDLVMPGINGLDLVRQYREAAATRAVPVIVLSTKEDPATKVEAFKAGANDYLVKLPATLELVARIRYHSRAYLDHVQRAAAFSALRESQRQLISANLELEKLTRIDGLTSLGNRRYFDEYIEAEWRRARRTQTPMSLLMIDVDNFKQYNDTYGHLAGDEVLKQVAAVIQTAANRSGDLAARFGGEEFVVVLPNAVLKDAHAIAERLVQGLRDLHIAQRAGRVTISAGVATMVPDEMTSSADIINAADLALFRAKAAGKDRAELHLDKAS